MNINLTATTHFSILVFEPGEVPLNFAQPRISSSVNRALWSPLNNFFLQQFDLIFQHTTRKD